MRKVITPIILISLVGCAGPQNILKKDSIIGPYTTTVTTVLEDGTEQVTVTQGTEAISENVNFNLKNVSGEAFYFDQFNKSFLAYSTKDEEIENLSASYEWSETGNLKSFTATIGSKIADASTPTTASFEGQAEVARATFEGITSTLEELSKFTSYLDVEFNK